MGVGVVCSLEQRVLLSFSGVGMLFPFYLLYSNQVTLIFPFLLVCLQGPNLSLSFRYLFWVP